MLPRLNLSAESLLSRPWHHRRCRLLLRFDPPVRCRTSPSDIRGRTTQVSFPLLKSPLRTGGARWCQSEMVAPLGRDSDCRISSLVRVETTSDLHRQRTTASRNAAFHQFQLPVLPLFSLRRTQIAVHSCRHHLLGSLLVGPCRTCTCRLAIVGPDRCGAVR